MAIVLQLSWASVPRTPEAFEGCLSESPRPPCGMERKLSSLGGCAREKESEGDSEWWQDLLKWIGQAGVVQQLQRESAETVHARDEGGKSSLNQSRSGSWVTDN
eukprot:CAMPEP_0117652870 /NCGR_PEP_ID=MMETSP0804-20121206/2872_1 /TAXON_ID=1074897 /ORGANISM="Tetraselmis astigmatica, Strain CCMP880" /LENGTH=103 /DNA_ID=CAMNT_0005458975 /DNA_START=1735 /DNA_END=2044 /DNA_ORIENTATION=-